MPRLKPKVKPATKKAAPKKDAKTDTKTDISALNRRIDVMVTRLNAILNVDIESGA